MSRDHASRARRATHRIQARWSDIGQALPEASGQNTGVGIGIDCGQLSFGEFGHSHTDITAIGTVVNTAARALAAAAAGQILLTEAVHARVQTDLSESEGRDYQLKGFQTATRLYAA